MSCYRAASDSADDFPRQPQTADKTLPLLCKGYVSQASCPLDITSIEALPECPGISPRGNISNAATFAIIGDYGLHSANCEAHVAELMRVMMKVRHCP